MHMHLDKPLYSVPEALALIKIGRTKMYQEIAAGRLKAVKAGERTLITGQSIVDWISGLQSVSSKAQ